jgi:hypothetical protein
MVRLEVSGALGVKGLILVAMHVASEGQTVAAGLLCFVANSDKQPGGFS